MTKKEQIVPLGHRLLIKPDEVKEEVSEGGIVLTNETIKADEQAVVRGTVLAIGTTCWKDLGNRQIVIVKDKVTEVISDGDPWCKVGDRVYFQRYSGMRIPNELGKYRADVLLLGDQDVTALSIEE